MKLFQIFDLGSHRKIDKATEAKIYETGERFLENHASILRGERDIFIDHDLTSDEIVFFEELLKEMKKSGFDPAFLKLHRLSSRTFNVDYAPLCHVGKINLSPFCVPDRYAVIKEGAKRALKVFDQKQDAISFQNAHKDTIIQLRPGIQGGTFMQCLAGEGEIKRMINPSLQECINAIPQWIKYLRYCEKQSRW